MTPKVARLGCAYKDCIPYYDFDGQLVVYQKDKLDEEGNVVESARSPSANRYVDIEHNLLDDADLPAAFEPSSARKNWVSPRPQANVYCTRW